MKAFFLSAILAAAISGCATGQPAVSIPSSTLSAGNHAQPVAAGPSAETGPERTVRPLPFKGRLLDGNPGELPRAVALSLSPTSPITFSYREDLTHDEYHIPLIVSAFDPVTYVGAPLGDYGVSAFASLTITDGDRIVGNYTAKAFVSKSYNLYSEPAHSELERAARTTVREKIDSKLNDDESRLARALADGRKPPGNAAGK